MNEVIYDVIFRRRDVRKEFNGEPIDPDVLGRILRAAHSAPSVGMSQPWDFTLVFDRDIRTSFRNHVVSEREVFNLSLPADRKEVFAGVKIEGILESSLGIAVSYDCSRGAPAVLGRHAIDDVGLYSVCLAIENLWLAATAEGIGVGWVSFYREEFLAGLLNMPEGIRPIAWLCVGPVSHFEEVPDLERLGWRARADLSGFVHLDTFDGIVGGDGRLNLQPTAFTSLPSVDGSTSLRKH